MISVTRSGRTLVFDIWIRGEVWGSAHGMPGGRVTRFMFKDAAGRNILRKDSEKMLPSERIARIDATLKNASEKIAGFVEGCIAEGRWPPPDRAKAEKAASDEERSRRISDADRKKRERWEAEARRALSQEDQVAGVIEAMKWAQAQ